MRWEIPRRIRDSFRRLRGKGYRFIAPVQIVAAEMAAVSVRDTEETEGANGETSVSGRAESRTLLSDASGFAGDPQQVGARFVWVNSNHVSGFLCGVRWRGSQSWKLSW